MNEAVENSCRVETVRVTVEPDSPADRIEFRIKGKKQPIWTLSITDSKDFSLY